MKQPGEKVFHVRAEEANGTLAAALRRWLPGLSWGEANRLLASRKVQVNGNLALDGGRRLKPAEVVKLLAHSAAKPPEETDIVIRHLDPHLVVVEKPAGMTSLRHYEERHWNARRKQVQPTLDELLPRVVAKHAARAKGGAAHRKPRPSAPAARRPSLEPSEAHAKGGLVPLRPVHRIDRETSGLMVFARTIAAERGLGEQFREHTILRSYLAIAHGDVREQTIRHRLVRDRGDGRRGIAQQGQAGKSAVTHVKPLERLRGYTLVQCRLETGRTHQIRLHLAAEGHPLCGEKIYQQPRFGKATPDHSGAPRLALHAAELGFTHPVTGEKIHYQMPLPADLQELLTRLRGSSR
ncbi:MAG TPA: RluA family pseudouridine synthase [Pirellulales bacterium]|jgi:23S rRNA pseudouridine1911/1915/1917 synthase|nr:RluA family pseudouridine synthase [Pirellulales bacterium]